VPDHYFTGLPSSPARVRQWEETILGARLTFETDAGVFSAGAVDRGTRLLLNSLPRLTGDVLDLGCGWGVIGVTLLAAMPDIRMTMTDINLRALQLTRRNLTVNHVEARVVEGGFPALPGRLFHAIVTNPPIRMGKQTVYSLFKESRSHLHPDGALFLVIRKRQGADSARHFLHEHFREVATLKKSGGYEVIRARP